MPTGEMSVTVIRKPLALPTYLPAAPDIHPMFLERRVYQGSSGAIYPLPFIDRIADQPVTRNWDSIWLENEYLQVAILPEIGGRIHVGRDKTNGYDFFYRQDVIKPALVGLAGPWISGGVEFNWPQHHRPATFMPVDTEIVRDADGSVTVWCSDHDPLTRMKGMHGVCLHPGKSYIELKVRLYNRTELVQTFLWWANAATRVHEAYQSFFPPDVRFVADHARRAISGFPLCKGRYYGVDYGARARDGVPAGEMPPRYVPVHGEALAVPNDLSFYANIPVPTSYMCTGTAGDFFGGYDHRAHAGLVHVADHRIAPGKKQWTWGNHEFGYAWDRNLTDPNADGEYAPYIELMAGVFSDNQPDFSFLMPGETRAWSQYWYPIRDIGPAQNANRDAAISLRVDDDRIRIGIAVTAPCRGASVVVEADGQPLAELPCDADPGRPFSAVCPVGPHSAERRLRVALRNSDGRELIAYAPAKSGVPATPPEPATEPPLPADIASSDELYVTGLHLEQYRHATRDPVSYWREALRRDPLDARCNNRLGLWHLRRGEFTAAAACFRRAIARLTARNANPLDGKPFYNLGVALRYLGLDDEAFDAFGKAAWTGPWVAAARLAMAELKCKRHDFAAALADLEISLGFGADQLKAHALRALVLQRLGRADEADNELARLKAIDPLDWWARHIDGEAITCNNQTRIDIALDYARAGFYREAIDVLEHSIAEPQSGTAPLIAYHLARLYEFAAETARAAQYREAAGRALPDYCFPARLEEIDVLQHALFCAPQDARAHYYLGGLFYAVRRHDEAIASWQRSVALDPQNSVAWRNLGIGYFNIRHDAEAAASAYDAALGADPQSARLLYERDQLWKRMGRAPVDRLKALQEKPDIVAQRDDLSVEMCALENLLGRPQAALAILEKRRFQPWEGGEGLVLRQHVRTHIALGRAALAKGNNAEAQARFSTCLKAPRNLGEAHHLLANQSEAFYWLGMALEAEGQADLAAAKWRKAAAFQGDFRDMSLCPFSDMTYFSALALRKLGDEPAAITLLEALERYASGLINADAKIDYFATSLPAMLLFEDDLNERQTTEALFLKAQALAGLGRADAALSLLSEVLTRDPSHQLAADIRDMIKQRSEPHYAGF